MEGAIPVPIVGSPVLFVDERRQERHALVKHVWPNGDNPAGLNVVIVSDDEARTDSCGRQVENRTSVPHISTQPAGGYAWKHAGG